MLKRIVAVILTAMLLIAGTAFGEESWDCPACGRTGNDKQFCGGCGASKPVEGWVCFACGNVNEKVDGKFCVKCGAGRVYETALTSWTCSGCGSENNAKDIYCSDCGKSKGKQIATYECKFLGANKTEDNPWGVTAGKVLVEDVGTVLLLTPDTSCTIYDPSSGNLSLKVKIHDAVREVSDGVTLQVKILGANNISLENNAFNVSNGKEWVSVDIKIPNNATAVKLECQDGGNNNSDGDWLIIS